MRYGLRLLWQDAIIKKSIILVLFILAFFIIIFSVKLKELPPQLPLFYSLSRGSEQLGNPLTLLILPISAFIIIVFNTVISVYFSSREMIISRILMTIGAIACVVLFITFIKIILIVT